VSQFKLRHDRTSIASTNFIQSLYLEQLRERLGAKALKNIGYTEAK
jgi:hypothetical protein